MFLISLVSSTNQKVTYTLNLFSICVCVRQDVRHNPDRDVSSYAVVGHAYILNANLCRVKEDNHATPVLLAFRLAARLFYCDYCVLVVIRR